MTRTFEIFYTDKGSIESKIIKVDSMDEAIEQFKESYPRLRWVSGVEIPPTQNIILVDENGKRVGGNHGD